MNALRWSLAFGVIVVFVSIALGHEDPSVLLVGLFPVAWIAVELVWRGFRR